MKYLSLEKLIQSGDRLAGIEIAERFQSGSCQKTGELELERPNQYEQLSLQTIDTGSNVEEFQTGEADSGVAMALQWRGSVSLSKVYKHCSCRAADCCHRS